MSAVLITIQNGTVDYCTDDTDTQVVIVDFDKFNPDTSFPDDVEAAMQEVLELPTTMPWRGGIVKRLQEVKRTVQRELLNGPTYTREGNYGRGRPKRVPGSHAGAERQPEQAFEPVQ